MSWRLLKSVWLSFGLLSMHCYAFIFGSLAPGPRLQDHLNLTNKRTHTFSKWHLAKRIGNMCHNLYVSWYDRAFSKDFHFFNINNFKNNHQFTEMYFSVFCRTQRALHRRASFSTSATLKTAIFHTVMRNIDACGMVVHNGLYIPVSQFAGLGNHFLCSSTDPNT